MQSQLKNFAKHARKWSLSISKNLAHCRLLLSNGFSDARVVLLKNGHPRSLQVKSRICGECLINTMNNFPHSQPQGITLAMSWIF